LEQRNAQYLRERNGWESQSRRNLDERQALTERLARLEGRLEASQGSASALADPTYTPGQLKSALEKWLNGDDADLAVVEQAFARLTPSQAATVMQPDDFKKLVRDELVELGKRSSAQNIVGSRHPDLANPQSELSRAVYEAYDNYAADGATQLMYARDPKFEVPMLGPDGGQKMVDARIVDRLAADMRLRGAAQEGRRQEQQAQATGSVQGGSGRATTTPQRAIEAIELLTEGERRLLADPKIRKGWPEIPADPKAAAKFLYDGLTPAEKAKRVAAYRASMRTGV